MTESEKAITAFVDGLKNPDVETRRYAVMMLGLLALEGQNTIPPLTAALDDPDLEVRTTAASGLAEFGSAAREALPGIERLLDEGDFARVTAIHAILNIDPSRAEELTPMLVAEVKSGTGHSRHRAVQVLGEIPVAGALAVQTPIALLDDADRFIREESLNSLRSLGPVAAPAVPKIAEILRGQGKDGSDILIRHSAVDALREVGPAAQAAVQDLVECLLEPVPHSFKVRFRLRLAHALWRAAVEPGYLLAVGLEALHSQDWWLRHAAVALLGDLGTKGGSPSRTSDGCFRTSISGFGTPLKRRWRRWRRGREGYWSADERQQEVHRHREQHRRREHGRRVEATGQGDEDGDE